MDKSGNREFLVRKAKRLEIITILFLVSTSVLMYLVMGSSQAMKTAWVEDVLSLIPPLLFLLTLHWKDKKPNVTFPYGYKHVSIITFCGASLSITAVGAFLAVEATYSLIKAEHPQIGDIQLLGYSIWQGWAMISVLGLTTIGPLILGRIKIPLAYKLHDKTLFADAKMNKADWMTALGGMVGVLGIGYGFWWADSLAALLISGDILHDGITNLKGSFADLTDRRPWHIDKNQPLRIEEKVADTLSRFEWIKSIKPRLRENGESICGELVLKTKDGTLSALQAREVLKAAYLADERFNDLVVCLEPET